MMNPKTVSDKLEALESELREKSARIRELERALEQLMKKAPLRICDYEVAKNALNKTEQS